MGNPRIPKMMFDKWWSFQFSKENNLPYADSFLYNNDDHTNLNNFIERHQFPLVAKPRKGFGSLQVFFIINHNQIEEIIKEGEILFQEYLGNLNGDISTSCPSLRRSFTSSDPI